MSFEEFWPRYLQAHSDPRTRALHVAGTIAATAIVLGAVALRKPWLAGVGLVLGDAVEVDDAVAEVDAVADPAR